MTAIFISPHIGQYGAERSMIAIMKSLKQSGIIPVVIIPKEGLICDILKKEQIKYIVCPFKNWINIGKGNQVLKGYVKFGINLIFAWRIKHLIHGHKVLFVHTNSIITSFGAQVANLLQVPHIQHIREFGDKDFNMCFDLGKKKALRYLDNNTSKVICVSNSILNSYAPYFDNQKCVCVYNGIAMQNPLATKTISKTKRLSIIMVGRLTLEKRQIDAIEAVNKLISGGISDIHLDLYGDGSNRENLEKYVKDHQLEEYVTFKGFCSNIDYSDYNVGIIASPNEAFGRVTVEYMLQSLAVVGAAGGGTAEIIEDGKSGMFFEACNSDSLNTVLNDLYNDSELLEALARNGKQRAEQYFSEKAYLDNIWSVYEKNLNVRRSV